MRNSSAMFLCQVTGSTSARWQIDWKSFDNNHLSTSFLWGSDPDTSRIARQITFLHSVDFDVASGIGGVEAPGDEFLFNLPVVLIRDPL